MERTLVVQTVAVVVVVVWEVQKARVMVADSLGEAEVGSQEMAANRDLEAGAMGMGSMAMVKTGVAGREAVVGIVARKMVEWEERKDSVGKLGREVAMWVDAMAVEMDWAAKQAAAMEKSAVRQAVDGRRGKLQRDSNNA